MSYLVTIGLEVHCQVKTNTKMFCSCETSFADEPNTHTCPVCLGLPGALPVLNQEAIEKTLLAGLMLGCGSSELSKWDRKNYFYPDMPKNYQTSQFDLPLCVGGEVPLYEHCYPTDARKSIKRPGKNVILNRIHLEEDVAKSTHLGTSSILDFNRAGTPLMEIVSEPDLESAEEVCSYLRSLQMILQQGGISDADMEKGQMRCDVNISLREKESDPLGAKVELKNLNSISAIRRAIGFEVERQAEELDMGIAQIQSTRRWDDDRGETTLLRTKEDAHDYRYFPCPDLLPVRTAPLLDKVRGLVPELPHERALRFERDFAITTYDATVLSSELALANFFEACVGAARGGIQGKKIANFLINVLLGALNEKGLSVVDSPISAGSLMGLLGLVEEGTLASSQAREVFAVLWENPEQAPGEIAKRMGFEPTNQDELAEVCVRVIGEFPEKVAEIRGGNEKLINWLTGQVMKASTSKPNPKQVTDQLRGLLGL